MGNVLYSILTLFKPEVKRESKVFKNKVKSERIRVFI